jgi:hypothetical protein
MDKNGESSNRLDLHKVYWLSPCRQRSSVWTYLRNPSFFLPLFYTPCILAYDHRRIKVCGPFFAWIDRTSDSCRYTQVFFPNLDSFFIPFGTFCCVNQLKIKQWSGFHGPVLLIDALLLSNLPIKNWSPNIRCQCTFGKVLHSNIT